MNKLWEYFGRICFIVFYIPLIFYLRIGKRTRVIISANGKILVVKGWLGTGKWGLPGGGLHPGEEPVTGAIREVGEETGVVLKPSQFKSLGQSSYEDGFIKFDYYLFLIELNDLKNIKKQKWEIIDALWKDVGELNLANSEKEIIKIIDTWKTGKSFDTMK